MAARVTLKAINEELARLGSSAEIAKAPTYFYFRGGETEEWLDRTVKVPTVSSLTLTQWTYEFRRLKKLNEEILRSGKGKRAGR